MDMKKVVVYLLIHEMDGKSTWGSQVSVHTSHESACAAMVSQWLEAVNDYAYWESGHGDEDECTCTINSATIRMFEDMDHWRIEAHTIEIPEEN